jgi:uncharacterized protein YcfL
MKKWMTNVLGGCVLLLAFTSAGCNTDVRHLVVDQLVGFASSVISASTTSLIQSLFSSVSSS